MGTINQIEAKPGSRVTFIETKGRSLANGGFPTSAGWWDYQGPRRSWRNDVSVAEVVDIAPENTTVKVLASTDPIQKTGELRSIPVAFRNFIGGPGDRTYESLQQAGVEISAVGQGDGVGIEIFRKSQNGKTQVFPPLNA